jgi:hydroxyacylglutathione hydrolase
VRITAGNILNPILLIRGELNLFELHTFQVGFLETNCYLIFDSSANALCIDPGSDADTIISYCSENKINTKNILLTHAHYDHIGGVNALVEHFQIPVWVHPSDYEMATNPDLNFSSLLSSPYRIDSHLEVFKGEEFSFGKFSIRIFHTPGHTPGSVCFYWDKSLISGDTLFRNSIGRSDFPGSNGKELIHSIQHRLMPLDDEVTVYPGHGMITSIGHERKRNPFIAGTHAAI